MSQCLTTLTLSPRREERREAGAVVRRAVIGRLGESRPIAVGVTYGEERVLLVLVDGPGIRDGVGVLDDAHAFT